MMKGFLWHDSSLLLLSLLSSYHNVTSKTLLSSCPKPLGLINHMNLQTYPWCYLITWYFLSFDCNYTTTNPVFCWTLSNLAKFFELFELCRFLSNFVLWSNFVKLCRTRQTVLNLCRTLLKFELFKLCWNFWICRNTSNLVVWWFGRILSNSSKFVIVWLNFVKICWTLSQTLLNYVELRRTSSNFVELCHLVELCRIRWTLLNFVKSG